MECGHFEVEVVTPLVRFGRGASRCAAVAQEAARPERRKHVAEGMAAATLAILFLSGCTERAVDTQTRHQRPCANCWSANTASYAVPDQSNPRSHCERRPHVTKIAIAWLSGRGARPLFSDPHRPSVCTFLYARLRVLAHRQSRG
jgi:hypothetical protein